MNLERSASPHHCQGRGGRRGFFVSGEDSFHVRVPWGLAGGVQPCIVDRGLKVAASLIVDRAPAVIRVVGDERFGVAILHERDFALANGFAVLAAPAREVGAALVSDGVVAVTIIAKQCHGDVFGFHCIVSMYHLFWHVNTFYILFIGSVLGVLFLGEDASVGKLVAPHPEKSLFCLSGIKPGKQARAWAVCIRAKFDGSNCP